MNARPNHYSPALGAEICAYLAAGGSLNSLCQQPGRPSWSTVARWLARNPDFQSAYDEACAQRAGTAAAKGVRDASLGGPATDYCPDLAERICALRAQGHTVREIVQRPDMPSYGAVYNWLRVHEDFRLMFRAAAAEWAEHLGAEQLTIADEALASGWVQADDRSVVTARDALMLAKLRIDTRERQIARMALRKHDAAPAERPMTHEEALDELE